MLQFTTSEQRLSENYNKTTLAIFGRAKVGKTSLVKTLPPETTMFINLEAGMKSIMDWRGISVDVRTWQEATDIACLIGGVDPAAPHGAYYCPAHYEHVLRTYAGIAQYMSGFRTFFFDSVTDLTRVSMTYYAATIIGEKSGKPDTRGAYGAMGREVVRLLRHVQHAPGKNVVFVGGLDYYLDEYKREVYEPQSEGAKAKAELPFIVDQVITMSDFDFANGEFQHNFGKGRVRALCCKSPNPWGLPGGDRSGKLDLIEEPHLGKLISKINSAAL